VDFGDSGDDAVIESVRWLNDGEHRVLHAAHVIDPDDVKDSAVKPALVAKEEALSRVPAILSGWIQQLAAEHGLTVDLRRVQSHVRIGKAVETLLQVAIDYEADLLIVGTHGRRGIDRLLLGSVAETLVRNGRCPVLVARPTDYTGATKTKLPDAPYAKGEEPRYSERPDLRRDIRTESDIWQPTGARPTGFRIV
jgi:nucleotide-binding universal stress UspA family protein